jgi:thiamine biosynthesis lipoprotein
MAVMERTTFELWGGTAILATFGEPGDLQVAEPLVHAWLDDVDRAASTYRDDSEIAALNRAQGRPTHVGPVLRDALLVALAAADRSEGLVDPTIGSVTLSAPESSPSIVRTGTHRDVTVAVDDDGATVTLPDGMALDLGATAKAWAADRAATLVEQRTGAGVLVSLAGDIAMVGPSPDGGWVVVCTDDHRESPDSPGPAAQTVSLRGGGLATSSTTVRRRETTDGASVPHVFDPVRWRPVVPIWRTVSVAAGDCVTANTASTAALVLGADAEAWLTRTGLPARLIGIDGEVARVGDWPAPDQQEDLA